MSEDRPTLDLSSLLDGMPGLTSEVAGTYVQAASVCLEGNSHEPGVIFTCAGWRKADFALQWPNYDDAAQVSRTWGDDQFATECGAYGVAIALVCELSGKVVWSRSAKGPGFDFWLCDPDAQPAPLLFQGTTRLEVSGILRGSDQVAGRIKVKTMQISPSNSSGTDAYVVVVEFGSPQARVVYV